MLILGVCFILYYLKLSGTNGFNKSGFVDLPPNTCSKSIIKTVKLDTRAIRARVDLI